MKPKKGIDGGKLRSVCNVINKVRVAKGWSVLPASEAEITATVWIEILDGANVPPDAYDELYQRAMKARARMLSEGGKVVEVTPEYLSSFWIGQNGLKCEREASQTKRLLPETAESSCPNCKGTGWKRFTKDGYTGVAECHHAD
jgi:hypothetical protein